MSFTGVTTINIARHQLVTTLLVAVVTTVKGAGGNAQKAFEILSMQLSNYDLQVFEKFHLITKSEHQNEKSILNNRDVIESLNSYAEEFLDL